MPLLAPVTKAMLPFEVCLKNFSDTGCVAFQMDMPPEASMRWALTQRLSSESREAIIGPMSSGRPTRPSAVMSATRLLISGLSRTIPPLKSVAMDGYRQKAFLMTKINGRTRLLVEAAGVELFWVLTTRYLLIPGTATTARRASLPDPLYVYCTKIPFAPGIRPTDSTEQSTCEFCPLDFSTSMVFTRRRQAQSPLPLDRAHGTSVVLPSRLSLPRALAQD